MNDAEFLRTPVLQNSSGQLLLWVAHFNINAVRLLSADIIFCNLYFFASNLPKTQKRALSSIKNVNTRLTHCYFSDHIQVKKCKVAKRLMNNKGMLRKSFKNALLS